MDATDDNDCADRDDTKDDEDGGVVEVPPTGVDIILAFVLVVPVAVSVSSLMESPTVNGRLPFCCPRLRTSPLLLRDSVGVDPVIVVVVANNNKGHDRRSVSLRCHFEEGTKA